MTWTFSSLDDLMGLLMRSIRGENIGPVNRDNPGEFTIRPLSELALPPINPRLQRIEKPLLAAIATQRQPSSVWPVVTWAGSPGCLWRRG